MVEVETRQDWCRRHGIAVQVLSPWMDIQPTHAMSAADSRDWARRLNASMADLVRSEGPQGPLLATVAVHDPDLAAEDLRRAVVEENFDGLILSTDPPGQSDLAAAELEPLWAAAAELGVPVMLHPPTDGPSSRLPSIGGFGNVYGRAIDTTLAASRLLLAGVLDRHPGLQLILVHGGGFLPYQLDRFDGGHRLPPLNQHALDRETPSAYLQDLYFDTVAMSRHAIGLLDEVVGSSRLLFGSDYPFPLGGAEPARPVREAFGPGEERDAVLGNNAAALFSVGAHV